MTKDYWIKWIKAAGMRAIKTAAQTLVTLIGTNAVSIVELDWVQMAGVTATTAVLSLLTSLAGLPELDAATDAKHLGE
ncbi:MAG: holin [Coriobacteriaceae bacterium]|nr:holin [Coriobacteriaceae bacterium]